MESEQVQNNCPNYSEVCGDVITVGMVVVSMSCSHVQVFQTIKDFKILYFKFMVTLKSTQ